MKKMEDINNHVFCGDCLDVMAEFPDNSIDSIVTDPPYGLKFMSKEWDREVPGIPFWEEALRVVKPGAHMLAFGGTRTHHRLMTAIEDAGWEIRDCIMWIYGSGRPKSLDISKAIKKIEIENAEEWDGWGTGLKPAYEPIILARKPVEGTIAENVLAWGCGGINIDICRVESESSTNPAILGRWPGNIILDEESGILLDYQSGNKCGAAAPVKKGYNGESKGIYGNFAEKGDNGKSFRGDTGGASRFFYCAKASRSERGEDNDHLTVKPLALIRYLIRLITPLGGLTLDMFAGSGTAAEAALDEGMEFVCIDIDPHHIDIIKNRVKKHKAVKGVSVISVTDPEYLICQQKDVSFNVNCNREIQLGIMDFMGAAIVEK